MYPSLGTPGLELFIVILPKVIKINLSFKLQQFAAQPSQDPFKLTNKLIKVQFERI